MYITNEFEADSMLELKKQYADFYAESFINEKNVGYIVCRDDMKEIEFPKEEMIDFINDVNDMIDNER